MKLLGWFEVVVGVLMAAMWALLLAAGQVPEVAAGQRDIWFHLAAELLAAGLLVGGGVALLRRAPSGRLLAAVGLGALLYTTVNSAGYYAELGEWPAVAMFLALTAVTAGCVASLLRGARAPTEPSAAVITARLPRQPLGAAAGEGPPAESKAAGGG